MHVKYFQSIASIGNHYEDHFYNKRFYEEEGWEFTRLSTKGHMWGVDDDVLMREWKALEYLKCLQHGFALGEKENLLKPSPEVISDALNRHLDHIDKVFNCNADTYKKCPHKRVIKEYLACRHYLFKFTLQGWYDRLPDVLLTFENKYPKEVF